VAIAQDQIVGEAMLILGRGCDRHIGEIHIYLCSEYRGRGLGNAMIKALMDVGQDLKLLLLYARTAASRTKDIRAFQALGFKVEHTFKDRFMDAAGDTQDAVEVALYLRRPSTTL
jgi:RimJ/RimL family protein N-acetyltransferase